MTATKVGGRLVAHLLEAAGEVVHVGKRGNLRVSYIGAAQ